MLGGMNFGHNSMALWSIDSCMKLGGNEDILDIGCGGGKNIANFLRRTSGKVYGIDYSPESVRKSLKVNNRAVAQMRTAISEANVSAIPYENGSFDLATAFETIYFWDNIDNAFREVCRVLKVGGRFAVCNELANPEGNEIWMKTLNMPIYTPEQIRQMMLDNGFGKVEIFHRHKLPHITVIGIKKDN